ncbi:MAG: GAF domain-containing protein [Pseudolabrys sp.]|jgi:two-component system NtrC family sensor kinase
MTRRATTGGKAGKARRGNTKSRRTGHLGSASTLQKQLRERTRELVESRKQLAEALEQQAATSEILGVISKSPTRVERVFEIIAVNALRLCGSGWSGVMLFNGETIELAAIHNLSEFDGAGALRRSFPRKPSRTGATDRAISTNRPCYIADVSAIDQYDHPELVQSIGYRSILSVPMLRGGQAVGAISIVAKAANAFSERQQALLCTFADQAVIAIENARLFDEVRQRTDDLSESLEYQTATSEVLNVISRSPTNVQPVFDAICESASRLCDAVFSVVWRYDGDLLHYAASHNFTREVLDNIFKTYPKRPDRSVAAGRAILDGRIAHVPDMLADPEYSHELALAGNWRASLAVPMLRDGKPVGAISVGKAEAVPFSERQMQLLTTFADQAVIAIENARLFDEVQARTRELATSLEDLRTTQDRLVQTEKLASLGQLTAGIAHEIKNPLNFVNNFSGVSVELIDELQATLGTIKADDKTVAEISELADTLRGNLDKIVQHGKRADAIVKNMLQHSRQGSAEHRPADINALVEESLNLAYHGARAEKQGFNITLKRSLDPAAGEADVFPQDITRVLLNLISNGFYAATRRKAEGNGGDYKPVLAASTRDLGDRVEIRIRDNGTGIPPEVKEQIFNPFFTTKPAGEGTGLGLSISHDIIVKQHGGSIEVDTRPGEFTEFRIVFPRKAATLGEGGALA